MGCEVGHYHLWSDAELQKNAKIQKMKIQDIECVVNVVRGGPLSPLVRCRNAKKCENTKIQKIQKMKIQDIECVVNVVRGGPLSPLVRCRTAKKCKNTKIQKHENT